MLCCVITLCAASAVKHMTGVFKAGLHSFSLNALAFGTFLLVPIIEEDTLRLLLKETQMLPAGIAYYGNDINVRHLMCQCFCCASAESSGHTVYPGRVVDWCSLVSSAYELCYKLLQSLLLLFFFYKCMKHVDVFSPVVLFYLRPLNNT